MRHRHRRRQRQNRRYRRYYLGLRFLFRLYLRKRRCHPRHHRLNLLMLRFC